jgi:outer membrane lipoprotein carrier protein
MIGIIRRFLVIFTVASAAAIASPHFSRAAKAMDPREGLELVRDRFAALNDFTAEITQEKQIALLKRTMTSSGQVRFKRPDLFYMEVYSPYPSRLLLKDNVLTMVLPADGVRQKTVLPRSEGLSHWFRLLDQPVTRLPEGIDVGATRHDGLLTLVVKPREKKGIKEIRLTIQEDGRPRKLVIEEQNLDRTIIRFRKVKKNVGLSDDDFRID